MTRLLLALALLLASQGVASAQTSAPSLWKNQRGGELMITSIRGGRLVGTFTNGTPGFACPGTYPVTGVTGGPVIRFTVNFAKCRSVANWSGSVQGLGMTVPWTLQYVSNGKPATTTGFDLFTKYQ